MAPAPDGEEGRSGRGGEGVGVGKGEVRGGERVGG